MIPLYIAHYNYITFLTNEYVCMYTITSVIRSKWGMGDDLYFQVIGVQFSLVFPFRQVLKVDRFSVGWLMFVG